MKSNEIVAKVAAALESLNLPYMLVGSYSASLYGLSRATKDADFVVQVEEMPVSKLANALGPDFHIDRQMSFEGITTTTRYKIGYGDHVFMIEVFLLSDDPHDQIRFSRRQQRTFLDGKVFVPAAEDVIITKLRWGRRKDIEDVRAVVAVQGEKLDLQHIRSWCEKFNRLELFDRIWREEITDPKSREST